MWQLMERGKVECKQLLSLLMSETHELLKHSPMENLLQRDSAGKFVKGYIYICIYIYIYVYI